MYPRQRSECHVETLQDSAGVESLARWGVYGDQPGVARAITERDTPEEVMRNVSDALEAALELYEDSGPRVHDFPRGEHRQVLS